MLSLANTPNDVESISSRSTRPEPVVRMLATYRISQHKVRVGVAGTRSTIVVDVFIRMTLRGLI